MVSWLDWVLGTGDTQAQDGSDFKGFVIKCSLQNESGHFLGGNRLRAVGRDAQPNLVCLMAGREVPGAPPQDRIRPNATSPDSRFRTRDSRPIHPAPDSGLATSDPPSSGGQLQPAGLLQKLRLLRNWALGSKCFVRRRSRARVSMRDCRRSGSIIRCTTRFLAGLRCRPAGTIQPLFPSTRHSSAPPTAVVTAGKPEPLRLDQEIGQGVGSGSPHRDVRSLDPG